MKQTKQTHGIESALNKWTCTAMVIVAGIFLPGCAQVMCMKQPRPFSPASLNVGERRVSVIGELGRPAVSEQHDKNLTDVYRYTDGGAKNNGISKAARIIVYTGGDVFTAWMDQVVWMPMEKFGFAGTDHEVTVDFVKGEDDSWLISHIDDRKLKGRSASKEAF